MKWTHLRMFEKHLQESPPLPLYLVISKEEFDRRYALQSIVEALRKELSTLSIETFDGEEIAKSSFFNELNTLSFFTPRRAIVIRSAEKIRSSLLKELEHYSTNPHPSTTLILAAASYSPSTSLYKAIESGGAILDLPEEKPWEREKSLVEWLIATAQANQKSLSLATAQAFLQQVGFDKERLSHELDKLCCYVDTRREISAADLQAIVVGGRSEDGWELGKALLQRNPLQALRLAHTLLEQDSDPLSLLAQLRVQFQRSLQICALLAHGGDAQEITKLFPYMRGAILDRNIELSSTYGRARLRRALLALHDTELTLKNQPTSPEVLIDILLTRLAS